MSHYLLDTVVENTDGSFTAYVKLLDDTDVFLANLCVTYKDDATFASELARKETKALTEIAKIVTEKDRVQSLLDAMNT